MNLHWADSVEPSLPREVMQVDVDGVTHLDAALLAEIVAIEEALDDEDDSDSELRLGSNLLRGERTWTTDETYRQRDARNARRVP